MRNKNTMVGAIPCGCPGIKKYGSREIFIEFKFNI
jgi:hypothetical protein